jgi:hypothetical protein
MEQAALPAKNASGQFREKYLPEKSFASGYTYSETAPGVRSRAAEAAPTRTSRFSKMRSRSGVLDFLRWNVRTFGCKLSTGVYE